MNQPIASTHASVGLKSPPSDPDNEHLYLSTDPEAVGKARSFAEGRARELGMGIWPTRPPS